MWRRLEDAAGAVWEKHGNTAWLECPACRSWFPVAPSMLRSAAPCCHCPGCHAEAGLAEATPQAGRRRKRSSK